MIDPCLAAAWLELYLWGRDGEFVHAVRPATELPSGEICIKTGRNSEWRFPRSLFQEIAARNGVELDPNQPALKEVSSV